MTAEQLANYLPQWGELASEGGRLAYNWPSVSADELETLRAYLLGDCLETAQRGECCGKAGACVRDMAALANAAASL